MGDLPLPQPSPQGGTKRERDSDSPPHALRPVSTTKDSPRTIAGSRRVTRDVHSQSQQCRPPQPPPPQAYRLPVYSNDLGRLPLHGQVNFQGTATTSLASTSSGSMHSSDMWFSSLSSGTQQPTNPGPAPMTGHNFPHGDAYTIDSLFFDQMSNLYGSLSAPQTHAAAGHDGGSQPPANNLQAYMDPSVASGVQPSMMHANGMFDVDPDTIAMWSSAPTGFGCVSYFAGR